jgi:hypothetical protein
MRSIFTLLIVASSFFATAQVPDSVKTIIEQSKLDATLQAVIKEYTTSFNAAKGENLNDSGSRKKWLSSVCLEGAEECSVNYSKSPKEAIYWRSRIGKVDTIEQAYALLRELIEKLKRVPIPGGGNFNSVEPVIEKSAVDESYIHIMKPIGVKDIKLKDLIAAISIAQQRQSQRWTIVLIVGKTEYEF